MSTKPDNSPGETATLPLIADLRRFLPKGEHMTYKEKVFWLQVGATLTEEELQNLARVVAFMRKTGGF